MFLMEHVWSQEIISKTLISVFEGTIILQFLYCINFSMSRALCERGPGLVGMLDGLVHSKQPNSS